MMRIKFIFIFLLITYVSVGENIFVKVQEEKSKNLLSNAEFYSFSKSTKPDEWSFSNFSKTEKVTISTKNGSFLIKTPGRAYCYLISKPIAVEEGKSYYAEVELRISSRALLWVVTTDYHDNRSPQFHPFSQTTIYGLADPEQGDKLIKELKYFIPERLLQATHTKKWFKVKTEFTVPKVGKIKTYDFRIGAYGGKNGFIEIRRPIFREALKKVKINIRGKDLINAKIFSKSNEKIANFELSKEKDNHQIATNIPSSLKNYYIDITTVNGEKIRRNL